MVFLFACNSPLTIDRYSTFSEFIYTNASTFYVIHCNGRPFFFIWLFFCSFHSPSKRSDLFNKHLITGSNYVWIVAMISEESFNRFGVCGTFVYHDSPIAKAENSVKRQQIGIFCAHFMHYAFHSNHIGNNLIMKLYSNKVIQLRVGAR